MDLDKLKVVDLRKELQDRGLDTKGVKAVLVKRLKDALDAETRQESKNPSAQAPASTNTGSVVKEEVEEAETKEVSVKVEPKSPKKEPVKTAAEKKESPSIQTPKMAASVINQEVDTPKIIPEPKEGSPVKSASPIKALSPSKVAHSEIKSEAEVELKDQGEKMETLDTESRGEKRKRDEDGDNEMEEETQEKRRKEETSEEKSEEAAEKVPLNKPEVKRAPIREDEPEINDEKTQLSWFDSDLHLKIDNQNFLSAKPINEGCFGYVWAGARANHGISLGKICFEVKITEEMKWEDLAHRIKEKTNMELREKNYRFGRKEGKHENEQKKEAEKKEENKNEGGDEEKKEEQENKIENEEKEDKSEITEQKSKESQEKMDTSEVQAEDSINDDVAAVNAAKESNRGESSEDKEKQPIEEEEQAKEEKKAPIEEEEKAKEEKRAPIATHFFRVGFSLMKSSLQLGESKNSYAYESTGKFLTNKEFQDYGATFGVGDVIGAYLSIDDQELSFTFTVNGEAQPTITVPRSEIDDIENFALFPHILCRNYAYEINFGTRDEPWFPIPESLKEYTFLQNFDGKVVGPQRPEKREECEVLLMVGLPGTGKTYWIKNHLANNTDKQYTVIGNKPLFDRMTVEAEPMKSRFPGSWKILVDRMQKCLNQLTDIASLRRRNFIIDQTNVFPNAQRRKLRGFEGFKRKAVVVVCDEEEHARRQMDQENDYGKVVPETTMYDLKAQFELPEKCEWIEEIIYTDLQAEEAKQKVKEYNEEANKRGYYKRKFPHNPRGNQHRNFRGNRRFGDRRGDFGSSRGPNWNRPSPWGNRQERRGPQQRYGSFKPRGGNQRNDGYNNGRNQGGGRSNPWQGGWGGGNNQQRGWNASMYGSHGYGAWNQGNSGQQTWKYDNNQGYNAVQGQRDYNTGGNYSNQGYGSGQGYNQYGNQGYSAGSQGYGQGQGYGPQSWNWSYAQYNQQQQGWGSNQQKKRK